MVTRTYVNDYGEYVTEDVEITDEEEQPVQNKKDDEKVENEEKNVSKKLSPIQTGVDENVTKESNAEGKENEKPNRKKTRVTPPKKNKTLNKSAADSSHNESIEDTKKPKSTKGTLMTFVKN